MDSCALGSPMSTLAGDRSESEGTHLSLPNSSGSVRFGASAGSTSLSSTDAGYVSRTVSVSELLAFRNKDGKTSGKQVPIVLKDSMPVTSSFSTLNFSSGVTTINGSTVPAVSSIPPSVGSSGLSHLVDGRRSSAAASKDSKFATCCVSAYMSGLKQSTSSSSSGPFVFSAGASDIGPLKPATQTNGLPGHFFPGSRPASQSNIFGISMDGLFSGKSRPGVQPDASPDNSLLGPTRAACPPNASNYASSVGSSELTVQLNALRGNLFSVPPGPASPVSSSAAPSILGSSKLSSRTEVPFEMQSTGVLNFSGQSTFSSEELLGANAVQSGVEGFSKCTIQRETCAESDQGISADISRKLNQLDIDKGIHLFRKLKKLGLDREAEKIVKPTPKTEVEHALKNLDIDKDSLPLKMEKLAVNVEGRNPFSGKSAFVCRGQNSSTSGNWTPSSATSGRVAASVEVDGFLEYGENERSKSPPVTNISFFKFGAEAEVKPRVAKVKMGRFRHRPFRPTHRLEVKKSASTTCSERPEEATSGPIRDGVPLGVHIGHPVLSKSLIQENDEGESDKLIGGDFGGDSMNSITELEACIQEMRAAVSELNFGAGFSRENETLSAVPLSNALEQNSWLVRNLYCEGVSNSAGPGQGWEATHTAHTQSVDRSEHDNYLAVQGDPMNEVNVREDVIIVKEAVAARNEDGTESSSGPQSCNVTDGGQPNAEDEGKSSPFTFTACSIGISMSNLRRRTHKVHKSVGRVSQGSESAVPVLLRDSGNCTLLSTMKSDTWFGTASVGGLVGPGYREGTNAPGVVVVCGVGAAATEQVCERWRLKGNQAYAKGDFVKAEEFYSRGAGSVSPSETSQSCIRASMLCYSNRAATRMVVGRMREALADCMYAMAVDPSFFRVQLRAAGCHLALGETELAAAAFEECLRQAQGASKVDSKVLADASEGLKKSRQVAECLTQLRNLLQNCSSRDSVSALQLLNEALLASPHSEWLLERKASMLFSLQSFTEVVQVCTQTLTLAERNFPTLGKNRYVKSPLGWRRRMIVKANFHLGKLEEALEQLQQLQECSSSMFSSNSDLPGSFSAEMTLPSMELIRDLLHHKLEGNRAFQAGNFTEAVDHYNAALARNGESRPFCAVCLCNRAAASQALGQIADAIADCSRAIALDPRYGKAISRRASLHEKVRDYGQSSCDLRRLIAIYERQNPLQGMSSPRVDGSAGSTTRNEEELQQAKGRLMKAEEEMKKGIPLDHYSILGLELDCSASEIKKAYRKAALRHHPDKAGQFLMRNGDTGDDPLKNTIDGTIRKDGERLIDEVGKDSEQLFKLIGEAYAVLSDPAKRSRYDSEEDLRKFRARSSRPSQSLYSDQNHSWTNDGDNVEAKGWWSTSTSMSEAGSRSRASRQRDRWEGFNYQYQRWHPGPDAAQPDVYARMGRSTSSTYGSSHRTTYWRWKENPWDGVL